MPPRKQPDPVVTPEPVAVPKKQKAKKPSKPKEAKKPKPPPKEELDLGSWAQSVLKDPTLRKAIAKRATDGTLTGQEMRALLQWSTNAPVVQKRPSQWKLMLEVAGQTEVAMIANISRRAMGQPEIPIFLPGQTAAWTNEEIIAGKRVDDAPPKA